MANETAHTGTSVEVPAGGHREFPPFDKQSFPSQLLWLTVTFVALYLLMSRIALPRIDSILASDGTRLVLSMAEAVLMVCQAGPGGKSAAFREAKEHLKAAAGACVGKDVPAGAARAYRRVVSCIAGEAGTMGAKLWALWQRVAPWVK